MSGTTTETTCWKCNGARIFLTLLHVANGKCFACNGTGTVEVRDAAPLPARPAAKIDPETARLRLRVLYRNAREFGLTLQESTEGGGAPLLLLASYPAARPHFRALGWEV